MSRPSPGRFRVAHENVFVDNNDTKILSFDGKGYSVNIVYDCDGNRFLGVIRNGSSYPVDLETRSLILEKFALSLIAPKET